MKMKDSVPEAHFGEFREEPVDWRKANTQDDEDNDELLAKTPQDVIDMLGFDPLEEGWE
jgi:hypothetical protein